MHSMNPKPPVFIQIDLDGLWAIRRCYGYPVGDGFVNDPIYTRALPFFREILKKYHALSTLFVVGKDLEVQEKARLLQDFIHEEHEIACHTYDHMIGLTQLSADDVHNDIQRCRQSIRQILQVDVNGFRAPGYAINTTVWQVLAELGFRYDASLLQTPWSGILKKIVNSFIIHGSSRSRQFGKPIPASCPRIPFQLGAIDSFADEPFKGLWEIPVTVSPSLKLPVQISYAQIGGARLFLRTAEYYRRHNLPLSCVFHGIDLVDTAHIEVLPGAPWYSSFFFRLSWKRKKKTIETIMDFLSRHFTPYTISQWLKMQGNDLK